MCVCVCVCVCVCLDHVCVCSASVASMWSIMYEHCGNVHVYLYTYALLPYGHHDITLTCNSMFPADAGPPHTPLPGHRQEAVGEDRGPHAQRCGTPLPDPVAYPGGLGGL